MTRARRPIAYLDRARGPAFDVALGVCIALAIVALWCVGRAWGQEAPRRDPFAVLLARVAANESTRVLRPTHDGGGTAGELDADTRAIYQTVLAFAAWKRISPERALRRLAPHVTATKAPKRARHALYASLPSHGGERPALWVDSEHGPWAGYGRNWVRFRTNVAALVAGGAPRPCTGDPISWGGAMDEPIAIRRGLVRLACGDTVNGFWGLPPERVIAADVARGAR